MTRISRAMVVLAAFLNSKPLRGPCEGADKSELVRDALWGLTLVGENLGHVLRRIGKLCESGERVALGTAEVLRLDPWRDCRALFRIMTKSHALQFYSKGVGDMFLASIYSEPDLIDLRGMDSGRNIFVALSYPDWVYSEDTDTESISAFISNVLDCGCSATEIDEFVKLCLERLSQAETQLEP